MKAKLVFKDWKEDGESVYNKIPELSNGSFHSGTTFNIDIKLDGEEADELKKAIKAGFEPAFDFMEE